jgi:hypothetical protein
MSLPPCPSWCIGHRPDEALICYGQPEQLVLAPDYTGYGSLRPIRNVGGHLFIDLFLERPRLETPGRRPRIGIIAARDDDCRRLGQALRTCAISLQQGRPAPEETIPLRFGRHRGELGEVSLAPGTVGGHQVACLRSVATPRLPEHIEREPWHLTGDDCRVLGLRLWQWGSTLRADLLAGRGVPEPAEARPRR